MTGRYLPPTARSGVRRAATGAAKLRLFLFPFAGGGARAFSGWDATLPTEIEVIPIIPPGREHRMDERPFEDLSTMIEDLRTELSDELRGAFAFFGHSMGALIAFELTRALRRVGGPTPAHLFMSGHRAPQIERRRRPAHDLPDEAFREHLRELGGTPREVLDDVELMRMFTPLLRADLRLCERYSYADDAPLDVPITVLRGMSDPEVTRQDAEAWRAQTTADFVHRTFPGGHFYLQEQRSTVIWAILRGLSGV